MPDTFPFDVQCGVTGQIKARVRKVVMGDGYVQRFGDGLNIREQSWPVRFTGSASEAQAIVDWLDDHLGHVEFLWTPPLGQQGKYVCEGYDVTATDIDTYTVSATFVQVFTP